MRPYGIKRALYQGIFLPMLVVMLSGFAPKVGQKIEMDARRNARTFGDFRSSTKNVSFVAEAGLQGEISDIKQYSKTGNYGVQITVTSGTDANGRSRVGEKVWVYYEKANSESEVDPGRKYMKIMDAAGQVLNGEQIPERAESLETTTRLPATNAPIAAEGPAAPVVGQTDLTPTDSTETQRLNNAERARLETQQAQAAASAAAQAAAEAQAALNNPPLESSTCNGDCDQPDGGLDFVAVIAQQALQVSQMANGSNPDDPRTWLSPVQGARCDVGDRGYGRHMHPIYRQRRMHEGQDIQAAQGTPLVAPADGEIVAVKPRDGGHGMRVKIKIGNREVSYSHMSAFAPGLKKGMKVKAGDIVGKVGSTGLSTGPHLHLEMEVRGRQVDPMTVLTRRQVCK